MGRFLFEAARAVDLLKLGQVKAFGKLDAKDLAIVTILSFALVVSR